MMKSKEFVSTLKKIATDYKTLYIMGCFGAPMNDRNKARYSANNDYNKRHAAQIKAASADTFGFDCVCLIKGVLWGWCGDTSSVYGGAEYRSNGVPDINDASMAKSCADLTDDFSMDLDAGEIVWIDGHIGVYVGDGLVVEATPAWKNKVQITALGNKGAIAGYNSRTWTKHGHLPYVDYSDAEKPEKIAYKEYIVVYGDTLSKIAREFGVTVDEIADFNGIVNKNFIRTGDLLKIPTKTIVYTVKDGDTLSKIAEAYNTTVDKIASDNELIKNGQELKIHV